MTKAIRVRPDLMVTPIFEMSKVTRLTTQGQEETEIIVCTLLDAKGLKPLGIGISMRDIQDHPQPRLGGQIALGRAGKDAGLSTSERNTLQQHLDAAMDGYFAKHAYEAQLQDFRREDMVQDTKSRMEQRLREIAGDSFNLMFEGL